VITAVIDAGDETIANQLNITKFLGVKAQFQNFGPFMNISHPLSPSNFNFNAHSSISNNLNYILVILSYKFLVTWQCLLNIIKCMM
jgi:hypothetical protein